jgi:hypothetical protein
MSKGRPHLLESASLGPSFLASSGVTALRLGHMPCDALTGCRVPPENVPFGGLANQLGLG